MKGVIASDPTVSTPAKRPRRSKSQTESSQKTKSPRTPVKVGTLFKCHKCGLQTLDYANLICHIGHAHFREKLARLQGDRDNECGICHDLLSSEAQLILHMSKQHRAIDLPPKESLHLNEY